MLIRSPSLTIALFSLALLNTSICYTYTQFSTICVAKYQVVWLIKRQSGKQLILISYFLRSQLIWIYIVFKTGHYQAQHDKGLIRF